MSTRHKRNPKVYIEWVKLDKKHGGILNDRVHDIRREHASITQTEAKIKVLAEHGYDCMDTAIALGIDEGTVHNHHSHIRRKAGVARDVPFRSIFVTERQ